MHFLTAMVLSASGALPTEKKDSIFFLGPQKTGTTTLGVFFDRKGGYRSCHDSCDGVSWWGTSWEHSNLPSIFDTHNAFMDNGDHSDYEWLASHSPHARFILNTRNLGKWMISKLDHAVRERHANGCSSFGDLSACKFSDKPHLDNSDATILEWVVLQARHQDAVLSFFNKTDARRQRFAVVNVEAMEASTLGVVLDWVTRRDLSSNRTRALVVRPHDVPMKAAQEHDIPPIENRFAHTTETRDKIYALLKNAGCSALDLESAWYRRCANAIRKDLRRKARTTRI